MKFFDHKDLGNHLLQLCPKVVKHAVYINPSFNYREEQQKKKNAKMLTLTDLSHGSQRGSMPGMTVPADYPE
jgi:hypothetical protein